MLLILLSKMIAKFLFSIRIDIYKHTKYKSDTTGSMELHSSLVVVTHKQLKENIYAQIKN